MNIVLRNIIYAHNTIYLHFETNVNNAVMLAYLAGAVDEECFITSFEDVPTVTLFSAKDLEEQMKVIRDTVGDDKKDWKQRMDSVRVPKRKKNQKIFSFGPRKLSFTRVFVFCR